MKCVHDVHAHCSQYLIVDDSPELQYSVAHNKEDEKAATEYKSMSPHCILVHEYVNIQC